MNQKEREIFKVMLRTWCEARFTSPHVNPFHVCITIEGLNVCEQCGEPIGWDPRHGHWLTDRYLIEEEPY